MGCLPSFIVVIISWLIYTNITQIIHGSFWSDFWPNFVATIAGILIALWIDRRIRKEQEIKEQQKVLLSIIDVLKLNKGYASQYKGLLPNKNYIQDMETSLLQGLILRLSNYEIINDPNLLLLISDSYNHILLLQNKIDIQKTLIKGSMQLRTILADIDTDVDGVYKKIDETIEYINGFLIT